MPAPNQGSPIGTAPAVPRASRSGSFLITSFFAQVVTVFGRTWFCGGGYQSGPRSSFPDGVQAAHQVALLIEPDTRRTLPSAMQTFIPPVCPVEARVGSHLSKRGCN